MLIINESNRENNLLTEPTLDPNLSITEQMDRMPYNSKVEIPRELFHILTPVGSGFSGRVFKAELTSPDGSIRIAAVKSPKGTDIYNFSGTLIFAAKFTSYIINTLLWTIL